MGSDVTDEELARLGPLGTPIAYDAGSALDHDPELAESAPQRLRVERTVGHGTTATIHAGTLITPGGSMRVALAVPHPTAHHRAVHARALAAIAPLAHPQLPRALGRALHRDGVGTILAWAGDDLQAWLDAGGRGDPALAVAVTVQALGALAALHEAGITHGAIRPEHVLVSASGRVSLAGLGVLHTATSPAPVDPTPRDPEEDPHASLQRALRYLAPEQLTGAPTAATDVWAAALLACELAGAHPITAGPDEVGAIVEAIRGGLAPPDVLPAAVREVLRLALAPEPSRRPSAAALRAALVAVAGAVGLAVDAGTLAGRSWTGAPAAAPRRCCCVHLAAGLVPGADEATLAAYVGGLERVQALFSTEGHAGDVSLLRCAVCGGPVLELFVEYEGLSGSTHRYLTALTSREWDALVAGGITGDDYEAWAGERAGLHVVSGRATPYLRARIGHLGIDHRLLA